MIHPNSTVFPFLKLFYAKVADEKSADCQTVDGRRSRAAFLFRVGNLAARRNARKIRNMAHLSSGKINFSAVRERARKELVALMEKWPGTKVRPAWNGGWGAGCSSWLWSVSRQLTDSPTSTHCRGGTLPRRQSA